MLKTLHKTYVMLKEQAPTTISCPPSCLDARGVLLASHLALIEKLIT